MRTALILALGLAVGWLARELTLDKTDSKAASRKSGIRNSAGWHGAEPEEEPGNDAPPLEIPRSTTPAEKTAPEEEESADTAANALARFIKTQGPAMKAMAAMQAKPKVRALAAALGFDQATQERIEEELMAEVDAQIERALQMLLGQEDLDPSTLEYLLGMPPELSPEVEKKLAAFLSDEEVAIVREQIAVNHKAQARDMADAQIKMMDISDLSDGQRAEMRDIFEGRNFMKDRLSRFAKVTRNPKMLEKMLAGGQELTRIMKQQFEPTRVRVREVLRDDQFTRYEAYEARMIQQAEGSLSMLRAMATMGGK